MKKSHDLAVKIGEYTAPDGTTKGRYQTVGAVLLGEQDREVLFLSRWFNPAGVPDTSGKNYDSVLLYKFERREEGSAPAPASAPQQASPEMQRRVRDSMTRVAKREPPPAVDENIPF